MFSTGISVIQFGTHEDSDATDSGFFIVETGTLI